MADDALKALKRDELDKLAADAGVSNPDALPNKDAVVEAITGPNPALVPEPETELGEQEYTVVGPHRVLDHAPGDTFTALIHDPQRALLIESGHIVPTRDKE